MPVNVPERSVDERKFCVASGLFEEIDIAEIEEKITSTTIPMRVDKFLSLAPDNSK